VVNFLYYDLISKVIILLKNFKGEVNRFFFFGTIIAFWDFISFILVLPPWNYLPAGPGWVLFPLTIFVLALMVAAIDHRKGSNRNVDYSSMNAVKKVIVKHVIVGCLDRINSLRFWGLLIAFWDFISFRLVLPPWSYLPADPGWVLLPFIVLILALMVASIDAGKGLSKEIDYNSMNPVKRLIVRYIIIGFLERIDGLRFWGLFIAFADLFYILVFQDYFARVYELSLPPPLDLWVPLIILILALMIASIERKAVDSRV